MSEETFDPDDHTVEELREFTRDCDDKTTLRAVKTAEIQGKDRKTAKEAVDERLAALDTADDADADASDGGADADAAAADDDAAAEAESESDHATAPMSAADPETIVVRNPSKTTLHLEGLKGSLAPGETKEYPVSDRVKQHIRENTLQVVTSR